MAKKIKQFRFYGESDTSKNHNIPADATILDYQTGEVFKKEKVFPITQLGIQGPPGTRFYLNGSVNYITIGVSGIYDLDIKNGSRVTDLGFERTSLERINNLNTGYLIVDIIYGEED